MTKVKQSLKTLGELLARWALAVLTPLGDACHSLHAAHLRRYPMKRRAVAWDRAYATFGQTFGRFFWGTAVVLIGLDNIDQLDVSAVDIGQKIVNLDWNVIGTILLGGFVAAFMAGAKAWRKWAVVNGPPL